MSFVLISRSWLSGVMQYFWVATCFRTARTRDESWCGFINGLPAFCGQIDSVISSGQPGSLAPSSCCESCAVRCVNVFHVRCGPPSNSCSPSSLSYQSDSPCVYTSLSGSLCQPLILGNMEAHRFCDYVIINDLSPGLFYSAAFLLAALLFALLPLVRCSSFVATLPLRRRS